MKRDIKNYLHFYLGQPFRQSYIDYEPGQWTVWVKLSPERYFKLMNDHSINGVQLALRPLSDMSEVERGLFHNLNNVHHNKEQCEARNTEYLVKKGFDVFMLIDDGLAVNAAELQGVV